MLTDNEIQEFLSGTIENKNIDLKRGFIWKTKSSSTLEIIKDILAMANTQDGGKLIIGFDEKIKDFIADGENWIESFDQTNVAKPVNKYSSSSINLQVVLKPNFEWNGKIGSLVILDISEFEKFPIIAKNGIDSDQRTIFSEGDILIRTENASTEKIKDALTMKDLLHRAALKDRTSILDDIKSLLESKPTRTISVDMKDLYLEEISDFVNTFHKQEFFPTFEKGIWQLEIMPANKNLELIPFQNLWKIATTSQSRHRGWPFPIITEKITKSKNNYLETVVPIDSASRNDECWRLYRNGLFCWAKSMFENSSSDYQGTLSKVNSIWTITEMLLFASRVYGKVLTTSENLYIRLTLSGSFERRYHDELMSEYGNPVDIGGQCNSTSIVIERTTMILNLQTNLKNVINDVIEELDTHFGIREYDQNYTTRLIDQILNMQMIRPEY